MAGAIEGGMGAAAAAFKAPKIDVGAAVGAIRPESLGAIKPPEIKMPAPAIPDATANLAANLDTKLATAPNAGIQEVANLPDAPMPSSPPSEAPVTPAEAGDLKPAVAATPEATAGNPALSATPTETSSSVVSNETTGVAAAAKPVDRVAAADGGAGVQAYEDQTARAQGTSTETSPTATAGTPKTGEAPGPDTAIPVQTAEQTALGDKALSEIRDLGVTIDANSQVGDVMTELQKHGWQPDAQTMNYVQGGIDRAKNPAQTVAEAKPAGTNAETAKQVGDLEAKVKNGTATAAEVKQLRELKQDPGEKRRSLEQKALDGTITDQEAEELGRMNSGEKPENLTPEQQMEKLHEQVDTLGAELMQKMAKGEAVTPQDLDRLRDLRGQEQLMQNGFTPDQARAAIKNARNVNRGERQSRMTAEIQHKVQELMAIEMQIMTIPKTVDALRAQRQEVRLKADAKHREADMAMSPEARMQKKTEEYGLLMQISNINATIVSQKYMAPILDAKRTDLEQYVRRKLGVSSGMGAMMEWAGAKVKSAVTSVAVSTAEEVDTRLGLY